MKANKAPVMAAMDARSLQLRWFASLVCPWNHGFRDDRPAAATWNKSKHVLSRGPYLPCTQQYEQDTYVLLGPTCTQIGEGSAGKEKPGPDGGRTDGTDTIKFESNRFSDLRWHKWVIIYNFRGNSNDVPNQTAEALLLLLLGIDVPRPI